MFGPGVFASRRAEPPLPATVMLAGREVPVALVRSARARRILLRADAVSGSIRLTLPLRVAVGRGAAFLSDHHAWLAARVAAWPRAMPFVSGAAIPFDGGILHLALEPGRRTIREGDRLFVGGTAETLPGRVTRWLKAVALADLTLATHALTDRLGLPPAVVRVGDPAGRWGSCSSTGRIAYSWRLVLAPPAVRASVVAHEVAHLVHPNHGAAFWVLARELGGDPAPHRRWLARHGASLHWVGRAT